MVYCATAIRGGSCTDDECPNRHDISRCEPCNCAFPTPFLEQHQTGKKHLRKVALNGDSNSGGPQQPPSQLGPLNTQPVPPPTTPPPSSGGTPTPAADSCVIVSSEGGLDFATEGTGTPENLSFFADLTISITKTEVVSSLSVQGVIVEPLPNPYFSATLIGNSREVRKKRPRSILVSFDAPLAGNFCATLKITFIDRTRPNNQEFIVTRDLRGCAILPTSSGSTSNGDVSDGDSDTSDMVTDVRVGSEGTGIDVSPESGLEFWVERPRSDVPFATQTMQLVISKSSAKPLVFFRAASLRSLNDPAIGYFSAQLEGGSKWIKHKRKRTVTVSFTPQREGFCETVLELTFCDCKRKADFVFERRLRGVAD